MKPRHYTLDGFYSNRMFDTPYDLLFSKLKHIGTLLFD